MAKPLMMLAVSGLPYMAKKIPGDAPAYIIRDHGFYVWAGDMEHCVNMCEAMEYLLACEVEALKVKAGVSP